MSNLDDLDSRTAALLVIDLQNAFVHEKGTLGTVSLHPRAGGGTVAEVTLSLADQAATLPFHRVRDGSKLARALQPASERPS